MNLKKFSCVIDMRIRCVIIAVIGFLGSTIEGIWYDFGLYIPVMILGVLSNCCLFCGSVMRHKTLISIYLMLQIIQIIVNILGSIVFLIQIQNICEQERECIVTKVLSGIFVLFFGVSSIYFWYCAYCYRVYLISDKIEMECVKETEKCIFEHFCCFYNV